jgi:hypothetical protein
LAQLDRRYARPDSSQKNFRRSFGRQAEFNEQSDVRKRPNAFGFIFLVELLSDRMDEPWQLVPVQLRTNVRRGVAAQFDKLTKGFSCDPSRPQLVQQFGVWNPIDD